MERAVKISVITGIYNPDREMLMRAVRSIISQTMEDWEMILCDDGSSPEYREMIREAASLDKRIYCVRNERNRGLAYALNQCIRRARGEYIARMDDDDESRPERFEKQYDFLETHPEYQWTGSNAELFDENGVWGIEKVTEVPQEEDFLKYSPYIHPSVMFRTETLKKKYGYISSGVTRRCEDYELFMRLHLRGYRGYNIQENLLLYREDKKALEKRKMSFRRNEMMIRYRGFKRLGILKPSTIPYVFRPLAGGVIPVTWMKYMHSRREKHGFSEQHIESQDKQIQKIPGKRRKAISSDS